MKKKKKGTAVKRKIQSKAAALLITLILSFFSWATYSSNQVHLPDPGLPSEIYANEIKDDLRRLHISAIESAQKSITLLVYTLTDDSIIQALKRQAALGINVYVIVDAKASPYSAEKLGPAVKTLRRLGGGLMHCKILVIDEEKVLVGSSNMTTDSLLHYGNLVLGMHSKDLSSFILDKAKSLPEAGRGKAFLHQKFHGKEQDLEFWFLPDDSTAAVARLKNLIRSAKKTIRVAMFTWTRQDLAHEIIRAAKQGISVEVVIDRNAGKGSSLGVVNVLKANGVAVHLSSGKGFLHHKLLYIDGKVLVNGSANWTKAAFGDNDDCFVIIDQLNLQQRKKLDEEWRALYADSEAA